MDSPRLNKKIDVIIYSFQNKLLQKYIEDIFKFSSKENDIKIYLIDQNNINRKDSFKENFGSMVEYYFIKWDDIKSPIYYKEKFAKISTAEYLLHLGDSVTLEEGWDKTILSAYSDGVIFSGNSVVQIKRHNYYYIKQQPYQNSDYFQKSFYINRNFIFGKKQYLVDIGYPSYLKYYGEEEEMSLRAFEKKYNIYAVPQKLYKDNTIALDEMEYLPFSLTHNYNKFIENNSNGINFLINYIPKEYLVGNIFLLKTHFENNDVEYSYEESQIDKIGGDRYLNNIREIN